MPCYFVSNGVEIPMTNETFDVICNGFGNKELTDSETFLRLKKVVKHVHLVKILEVQSGESRTTDTTTENLTTINISKDITTKKRNNHAYAISAVLP